MDEEAPDKLGRNALIYLGVFQPGMEGAVELTGREWVDGTKGKMFPNGVGCFPAKIASVTVPGAQQLMHV